MAAAEVPLSTSALAHGGFVAEEEGPYCKRRHARIDALDKATCTAAGRSSNGDNSGTRSPGLAMASTDHPSSSTGYTRYSMQSFAVNSSFGHLLTRVIEERDEEHELDANNSTLVCTPAWFPSGNTEASSNKPRMSSMHSPRLVPDSFHPLPTICSMNCQVPATHLVVPL